MRSNSSTRGSAYRHPRSIFWIGICSLLLSLIAPLISIQASDAAAAGIDQQECDQGLVLDDQTGECVPEEQGGDQQEGQNQLDCEPGTQPNDEGTECVPTDNQQEAPECDEGTTYDPGTNQCLPNQPDEQSSGVQIGKYTCDPGKDWYKASYQDLGTCAENQQQVAFTYTRPDGQSSTDQVTSGFEWSPTAAGHHTISEQVPDGYGVPIFYCGTYVPQQSNPRLNPVNVDNGNSIGWDLVPGEWLYCQVFNIPLLDEILVMKHWCPPDLAFTTQPTFDDLDQVCTDTGTGAMFELDGPEGDPQQWKPQAPQGNPLTAGWNGVSPGDYTVTETGLDDGWSSQVFCYNIPTGQRVLNTEPNPASLTDTGGLEITVEAGASWYCHWFNFHSDGGSNRQPESDNSITVYKWQCVDGTEAGQDQDYYQGQDQDVGPCETEHLNIPISMIDANGDHAATTQANGTEWDGVVLNNGSFQIAIDEPNGYGDPMVFCGTLDEDTQTMVPAPGGTWTLSPTSEPFTYQCNVYDVPGEGTGSWIDFYKLWCPEGTPLDSAYDYLQQTCGYRDEPVTLTLGYGDSTYPMSTQGQTPASWQSVPTGQWSITEPPTEGYGQPIIYCQYLKWPDSAQDISGDPFALTWANGGASWEFEYEGLRLACAIFNIPSDNDNSVTVYKWQCVDGTEAGQDQDYYQGQDQDVGPCETEHLNIPISMIDANGDHPTTTQANGTEWDGVVLNNGSFQIAIDEPNGYGDPMVFCGTLDEDTQTMVPAPGGTWTLTPTSEPFTYQCNVYDVPGEGTGSWIDFYKLWCPEGTPLDSAYDYLQQNCEFGKEPIELTLDYGDSTYPMSTQGQTPASWQSVPTGQWSITEPPTEGYGQPIIYCQYLEWPDNAQGINDELFTVPWTNGSGTWEFQYNGLHLACAIFNIPAEGSWVDITKWWCSEDVTTPYEQSVDNLLEDCERYADGVDFSLEYGVQSVPMTTDGDGNAAWSDVPTGQWTMQESLLEGFGDPVVYCRWQEWPDGVLVTNEPFSVPAPAGQFSGDFKYDAMRLHCDVFNIPYEDPGHVTIYKWYCAESVPRDSSPEYLRENCDYVTTGVNFTLAYGEISIPRTTDSEGTTSWDNVPQGQWELRESPDPRYSHPVIFCQYLEWPDDANVTNEMFSPDTNDYSIRGTFDYPGLRLVCYWFNFEQEGNDNWITVFKYLCPPGSNFTDDLDVYLEGCSDTPMDGASFTLTSEQYPDGLPKVTAAGQARWQELDPGDYQLQEALPEGSNPPRIWCTTYQPVDGLDAVPALDQFEAVDAPEGQWRGTIGDGPVRIVCYVFNIPDDDTTITVYKYNCDHKPVGYTSLSEWLDACPTKGNDIEFTLDNSDGSQTIATSDGKAVWEGVPVEPFTLTEEPLAGYGKPVVWCGWTAYYNGAVYDAFPQLVDATGGVYHGEVTVPSTSYFCYWFNIPEDDSHITIYKYYCLEGKLDGVVPNPLDWYKEHCTEPGNGIRFTLDDSSGSSTKAIAGGSATWNDVPVGDFTLSEQVPTGYGEPLWWCQGRYYDPTGKVKIEAMSIDGTPGDTYSGKIGQTRAEFTCWVFNFPDRDHTIIVHKWYCPVGTEPDSKSYDQWASTCTTPMPNVRFTHEDGTGATWKLTDSGGSASWYGAERGENSLTEDHLPGYEPPVIYCELDARYDDGAAYAEGPTPYTVTDNGVSKTLDYAEFHWTCHVFNIPKGPGEITVYKWYCPPGYDLDAWNADPKNDCTQAMNGVPFTLDQPVGPNQISNTGDSAQGAVYFGDLDPGHYVVSETVPSDTDYVFIWDCVGGDIAKVHPHPLTWGNVLDVNIAGGDSIVCNWYNVPKPEHGWITLYKYSCSTETYKSEVDCEIYEFGASFELFQVDGNVSKGVQNTNAGGQITWDNLDEGAYSLDEISHKPCKITSTRVDDKGNAWVDAGNGTVIKVYNCKVDTSTTPQVPGKVPGKYPNTGVGPAGGMVNPSVQQTPEPDETPIVSMEGTPTDPIEAAEAFYTVNCLNAPGDADGTPTAFDPEDLDNEPDLPPFLQQTQEAEPTAEATVPAEGTPTGDEPCERGALPEHLVIDSANVNHDVEVVEIVDGVMQAPTGPNVVSWYKETARLGEIGNIIIAGHLNWWNVPEGPFFSIDTLQEGDRIEVTGEDGNRYVYEVQWVKQESNLAPPAAEIVGPTDEQSLTLITCGGDWDPAVSEYNARTVVRAIQVEVIPAEREAATSNGMVMDLAA